MNTVFVGLAGVPYRARACDSRLTFIAKMIGTHSSVTILNRYSSLKTCKIEVVQNDGIKVEEIINPRYTNGILTKILFLLSIIKEPYALYKLNKKEHIDIIHIYTEHFFDFILYWLISKVIGSKTVFEYVEYRSAFSIRDIFHKVEYYLYDKYAARFCDGVIAISEFLKDAAVKVNPRIKVFKIPPICDFDYFDSIQPKLFKKNTLVYCGSVNYREVIEFIIDAYKLANTSEKCDLVLILSGNGDAIEQIRLKCNDNIKIVSKLPYEKLISYYKGATALLIPLMNRTSEIARFPNKIAEYLASRGVIVTTNIGEIPYYFKDGDNAVVVDNYDMTSFSDKLKTIIDDMDITAIKDKAYKTGKQFFSIDSYIDEYFKFASSL